MAAAKEGAAKAESKNTLSKLQLIGYGFGDLGGCMTFAIMGSFLTPYYTDVAHIDPLMIAGMYMVLKIWDAINDPLMGALMDKLFARSHNPKGKFRPWMFRATPLLFITAILMYTAPTFATGMAQIVVAFVTYLLYEASYTMFNIPYGSLLAAMAHNDAERASCSSARGFGSMIGNLIPVALFPLIITAFESNPQLGYTLGVTVCAGIGLVCCFLSAKWTVERNIVEVDENAADNIKFSDILVVFKKNRAFVALCLQGVFYCVLQYVGTTLGIYMYRDVFGALPMMSVMTFVSMGVSCVFLAVIPKISSKVGLEATVRGSQLISAVLYIVTFFVAHDVYTYMVLYALANGFGGITVLMQWGMVGEAIDYNEYVTGKRTEGSIYGTFNLMRRIGQAIGSSGAVAMLPVIGYVSGAAAQSAQTILGIRVLVLLVPALFIMLCWVALKFVWNITPEIRAKMAAEKTVEVK